MENSAYSAERPPRAESRDEEVTAVWWSTAGVIDNIDLQPANAPTSSGSRRVSGWRGLLVALCGLAPMLAHGLDAPHRPPSTAAVAIEVTRRIAATSPRCGEPAVPAAATDLTTAPPHAADTPPETPEPPSAPTSPPASKRATTRDLFTRKARRVQHEDVQPECSQHVRRGHTVAVRVHHRVNTAAGRVIAATPAGPTGSRAEDCVIQKVLRAESWPTSEPRARSFTYHIHGRARR